MKLDNIAYSNICAILGVAPSDGSSDLEKLKRSISVLHDRYLLGAATEAAHVLKKSTVHSRFELIMGIYNRKIKEHQVLFLLIHLFEIALRSKSAVVISNRFSPKETDDWFRVATAESQHHQKLIDKLHLIAQNKHFTIDAKTTTFDLFHLLSFGDLEWLIKSFWSEFEPLFSEKTYKGQTIPAVKTKNSLLTKIREIRHARNDIFHNNPPKLSRGKLIGHIELLLLHLEYNLFDAVNNIDPKHQIIKLKYVY